MRSISRALMGVMILLAATPADAQLTRDHDVRSQRSFHGSANHIRRSFQADSEARNVLRRVLAAVGLAGIEDRIILRASAETDNAEAFIEKRGDVEERLIVYNAVFMQELAANTRNYWSMIAVLAHEVGHHVRFHTVIPGRAHEFELEADYQAGFIMRRMGSNLDQALSAFRTFPEAATRSHPGRAQRLQMVTLGWTDAGQAGAGAVSQPALSPLNKQTPAQSATALPQTSGDGTRIAAASIFRNEAPPPEAGAQVCAQEGGFRYCVSSHLPTAGINRAHYGPRNLFDNAPDTAWVENKDGTGEGEWIVISWQGERQLRGLRIVNGYARSAALHAANGKVTRLDVETSNGVTLKLNVRADVRSEQLIRLPQPIMARWLRITIGSAVEGTKYTDTAISELHPVFD